MKTDTTPPNNNAPMNPYSMQTYSMAPSGHTYSNDSPMHSMQSAYQNQMHQQQHQQNLQQPFQYQTGAPYQHAANTTQNVSVVDFKPDVMAQHQVAEMQHNYNQHMNSQAPSSIGLVGRDGRYIPATAAQPYTGSDMSSHGYGGHPPSTQFNASHPYNGYNADPFSTASHGGDDRVRSHSHPTGRGSFHRAKSVVPVNKAASKWTDIIDERIGTHASAVNAAKAASTESTRALAAMVDERMAVEKAKSSNSEKPMTASEMSEMLKGLKDSKHSEMKALVDERFNQLKSSDTSARAAVAPAAMPTGSSFADKTHAQQKMIVSNAVKKVMEQHEGVHEPRSYRGRYDEY